MENLLKPEITTALGWTLLHSLWQGIGFAVLYFGMSKFLKSSAIKYRLGVSIMLTQFGLAFSTLAFEGNFNERNQVIFTRVMHYTLTHKYTQNDENIFDAIKFFLSNNLGLIVQIWLIGVGLFFTKLLFDLWTINHLKTKGLKRVDNSTFVKFNDLMNDLKITKKIKIFESSKTQSPIVIGNLKPYILLPIGLTSGLTISELEAILAHELAHIKRYDFLVNIIQTVIEIIFFFNPTIWWISAQIRQEREHCCDDFSVSITGDKILLVNALARVETFRINQPLAMAFGKKRMTLLHRVQRILGVNPKQNKSIESIIVMIFISAIVGGLIVFKSDDIVAKASNIPVKVSKYSSTLHYDKPVSPNKLKLTVEKFKPTQISELDTNVSKSLTNSSAEDSNDNHYRRYINSNSRRGEFWINKSGEIYVNGKKYDASPELIAKIKPYLSKMDILEEEMEVYGKKMNEYSKEMEVYSKKMNDKSAPMNEFSKLMNVQGKLLDQEVKLQTKYALKASLAEIENEKSNKESYQKLEKEHEKKVNEISKEMEKLGKEMEIIGKTMEENGKPMEEIGKKMEVEGKKMEIVGKKMEVVSNEISNLLPEDLKKKINYIQKGN